MGLLVWHRFGSSVPGWDPHGEPRGRNSLLHTVAANQHFGKGNYRFPSCGNLWLSHTRPVWSSAGAQLFLCARDTWPLPGSAKDWECFTDDRGASPADTHTWAFHNRVFLRELGMQFFREPNSIRFPFFFFFLEIPAFLFPAFQLSLFHSWHHRRLHYSAFVLPDWNVNGSNSQLPGGGIESPIPSS